MNHRLISSVTAIAMLLGVAGYPNAAQAATNPGEHLKKFKEALEKLDLSTTQKDKIKKIMTDTKTSLATLKAADQAGGKTKMRDVIKSAVVKIMAVLEPAQKVKLKEILKADKASAKP